MNKYTPFLSTPRAEVDLDTEQYREGSFGQILPMQRFHKRVTRSSSVGIFRGYANFEAELPAPTLL